MRKLDPINLTSVHAGRLLDAGKCADMADDKGITHKVLLIGSQSIQKILGERIFSDVHMTRRILTAPEGGEIERYDAGLKELFGDLIMLGDVRAAEENAKIKEESLKGGIVVAFKVSELEKLKNSRVNIDNGPRGPVKTR